jgi:3-oxoadipate enol-lactonase
MGPGDQRGRHQGRVGAVMPRHNVSPGVQLYYRVEDFTDPWTVPQAVLLIHGNAESHLAWNRWIPHLAGRFRVVRPDVRGHGDSTPMPRDFPWTLDIIIDDLMTLMHSLGVERFHVIGAKLGATIARALASRMHHRVLSLTVIGAPPPFRPDAAARVPDWTTEFEREGLANWARRSQGARLGSKFPEEGAEWWTNYMARMPVSSQIGWIATIACADISSDISRITCPTLVITTEQSGLSSVSETRSWQEQIPNSRLLVLPGDSYHAAVSDADQCAISTVEFLCNVSTRHAV